MRQLVDFVLLIDNDYRLEVSDVKKMIKFVWKNEYIY